MKPQVNFIVRDCTRQIVHLVDGRSYQTENSKVYELKGVGGFSKSIRLVQDEGFKQQLNAAIQEYQSRQ